MRKSPAGGGDDEAGNDSSPSKAGRGPSAAPLTTRSRASPGACGCGIIYIPVYKLTEGAGGSEVSEGTGRPSPRYSLRHCGCGQGEGTLEYMKRDVDHLSHHDCSAEYTQEMLHTKNGGPIRNIHRSVEGRGHGRVREKSRDCGKARGQGQHTQRRSRPQNHHEGSTIRITNSSETY